MGGIFGTDGPGAPWRAPAERYGSWWATYDRFRQWAKDGTLQSVARKLWEELGAEGYDRD